MKRASKPTTTTATLACGLGVLLLTALRNWMLHRGFIDRENHDYIVGFPADFHFVTGMNDIVFSNKARCSRCYEELNEYSMPLTLQWFEDRLPVLSHVQWKGSEDTIWLNFATKHIRIPSNHTPSPFAIENKPAGNSWYAKEWQCIMADDQQDSYTTNPTTRPKKWPMDPRGGSLIMTCPAGTTRVTVVDNEQPEGLVSYDLERWLQCARLEVAPKDADIAMCTMVNGDSNFLPEWIEYHRMLGFHHFWIYANEALSNWDEEIGWYLRSSSTSYVTVIPLDKHIESSVGNRWLKWYFQIGQQNDCLERARAAGTSWLALSDLDEYIHVTSQNESLIDILEREKQRDGSGPLYMQNWFYGKTSRQAAAEEGNTTIQRYVYRNHDASEWHPGKSIVQPHLVVHYDVHQVVVGQSGRQPDPRTELHSAHFKHVLHGTKDDSNPVRYTILADMHGKRLVERLDHLRSVTQNQSASHVY